GENRLILGQWKQATNDFQEFLDNSPPNLDILYRQAAASLLAGDISLYRDVCRQLVEKFGQARQAIPAYYVARICTLIPDTPDDLVQSAEAAEAILSTFVQSGTLTGAGHHALAIVQYRSGKYEQSIKTARASIADKAQWNAREINRFVIALALNK